MNCDSSAPCDPCVPCAPAASSNNSLAPLAVLVLLQVLVGPEFRTKNTRKKKQERHILEVLDMQFIPNLLSISNEKVKGACHTVYTKACYTQINAMFSFNHSRLEFKTFISLSNE